MPVGAALIAIRTAIKSNNFLDLFFDTHIIHF